ncbi:MAG: NADH-quinone oxidoreductase subunit B family protein [Acidimicrobiales bacterium]
MPWIPRGLREGIVTTRYPRHPDGYAAGFRGAVVVDAERATPPRVAAAAEACPTDAITVESGQPRLDRGRCILCARCADLCPEVFRLDPGVETSAARRQSLVVPRALDEETALDEARAELGRKVRALRRSVHIRHVDAGSDGAEEWEVAALTNPVYDVQRLGISFTASPRHADLLLATGVGTAGMLGPLQETYLVMPEPKVVIAAGTDAVSGGLVGGGYASRAGVTDSLPVDVFVPGSPPTPFGLLFAILLAIGRLPHGGRP